MRYQNRSRVSVLLLVALALFGSSCGAKPPPYVDPVTHEKLNCDQIPGVLDTVKEFQQLKTPDGNLDFDAIETATINYGTARAVCALFKLGDALLAPAPGVAAASPEVQARIDLAEEHARAKLQKPGTKLDVVINGVPQ